MAKSSTKMYDLTDKEFTTILNLQPEFALERRPGISIIKAYSKKDPSKAQVVKLLKKRTPDELNKNRKAFFNEVHSTARLNHPNVVSDVRSAVCPSFFAICTSYYPNGNLAWRITDLSDTAKEFYISQLACTLYYIHCQGVVHLDLNPKHVLLDAHYNAVLSDFGNSRILLQPRNIIVRSGEDGFRAPEMSGSMGIDPFKADVYSLGAILWNMIFGIEPSEHAINYSLYVDDVLMLEENSIVRHILFGTLDTCPDRRWDTAKLVRELRLYLPAMSDMIAKLIDHDSLPPPTQWMPLEKLMRRSG